MQVAPRFGVDWRLVFVALALAAGPAGCADDPSEAPDLPGAPPVAIRDPLPDEYSEGPGTLRSQVEAISRADTSVVSVTLRRATSTGYSPITGYVNVYEGTTWRGNALTDGSGVALLTLPGPGPYRFHSSWWGRDFWSSSSNDCSPSSCPNTTITVSGVQVQVRKPDGSGAQSSWVNAYSGGPAWSTWVGNAMVGQIAETIEEPRARQSRVAMR